MTLLTTESFAEEKNQHVLTHWHNHIELLRILSGTMHCVISGTDYTLKKDDVCIINCRQPHRTCFSKRGSCTFQRLLIDPALFTADKDLYKQYIEPVLTDEGFSHVIAKRGNTLSSAIIRLIDEIADVERMRPAAYELEVVALLHLLFQRLYQYYQSGDGRDVPQLSTDVLLFRRIADFIYQNYPQKLSLDSISASGNVSRSKCCSVFKKYAGRSPIDFLNLYRLEISTGLLARTDDSIASIAAACGFGQQSYFNRLFLREYGVTPREYRAGAGGRPGIPPAAI